MRPSGPRHTESSVLWARRHRRRRRSAQDLEAHGLLCADSTPNLAVLVDENLKDCDGATKWRPKTQLPGAPCTP